MDKPRNDSTTRQEKALVFLLRICGAIMLSAFATLFLPVDWMAATHRWLGLGEFPESPLVDYLARSILAAHGPMSGDRLKREVALRQYGTDPATRSLIDELGDRVSD